MMIHYRAGWFASPIPQGVNLTMWRHANGRRWAGVAIAIRLGRTIWYGSYDRCCLATSGRHWVVDRIAIPARVA